MSALRSSLSHGLHRPRLALRASPASPSPGVLRISSRTSGASFSNHGRRGFHLSTAAGSVVDATSEVLVAVHQFGLPWYLTIPLLAAGVNFTIRLPMQYYQRLNSIQRVKLTPFLQAWATRHGVGKAADPREAVTRMLRYNKSVRRIYKTWGCQKWKDYALAVPSLAPLLLVTETLRQMSGAPTTWLAGFLTQGSTALGNTLFNSSLTQGGLAWFTDLTVMDPYFALPILTVAVLYGGLATRMKLAEWQRILGLTKSASPPSFIQRSAVARSRVLFLMPLLPLLMADLPSAVFLYWGTTFGMQGINQRILTKLLPMETMAPVQSTNKVLKPRTLYVVGPKNEK